MKKSGYCLVMAAVLSMTLLSGCQKAPEVSNVGEIPHAQDSAEKEVRNIVEGGQEPQDNASGGWYEGIIGTEENGFQISAQVPVIPEKAYQITLRGEEALNREMLTALLGSGTGNVRDVTEETLAEQEESLRQWQALHEDNQVAQMASLGDGSSLYLEDGEKEAYFFDTSVGYQDKALYDQCAVLYNNDGALVTEIALDEMEAGNDFPAERAEEILMDKLRTLGITEVCLKNLKSIGANEKGGFLFYEMEFVPSYEGIGVITPQQVSLGEIWPQGEAWVTEEGVAKLTLENFCGKVVSKTEPENLLNFTQVTKLLETYLQNGILAGLPQLEMNHVEFAYYPIYREPELELVPVWHISCPLEEYIKLLNEGSPEADYNIYINAATGEIIP